MWMGAQCWAQGVGAGERQVNVVELNEVWPRECAAQAAGSKAKVRATPGADGLISIYVTCFMLHSLNLLTWK